MAKNTYEIQVYTNAVKQGGTNGDIYIQLKGDYGTIGFVQIDNAEDNFEQGKTDTFFIDHPYSIGNILEVGLRLHYISTNDSWSAGWVKVIHHYEYFNMATGQNVAGQFDFHFHVNYAFNRLKGHNQNDETKFFPGNTSWEGEAAIPHGPGGSATPPPDQQDPTKPPTQYPELITPAPGWFEPSFVHPDELFTFYFPIANIGNAPASNFTIQLYLHAGRETAAAPIAQTTTPGGLQPGQGSTVYWIQPNGLPKGLYTCTIILDSTNVVQEQYEGATNTTYIEVDVSDSNIGTGSQPLSMPLVRQVQWVRLTKVTPTNPAAEIDMIGGLDHGVPWSVPLHTAIAQIQQKTMAYYTRDAGGRQASVYVDTKTHPGAPFLKTVADTSLVNNLRALPGPGEFYKDFKPVSQSKPLPL